LKKLLALTVLFVCAATLIAAPGLPKALATGSIAGTITDSATGQPIAGAMVNAGCQHHATTDGNGAYVISGLMAGDYTVNAMKCGEYAMKSYPGQVHVEEDQHVTGIDIALVPMGGGGGSGSISGTVYDNATRAPIAGARVMAGCMKSALTADDGTYTISNLADGSYTVKAVKSGYKCATYPSAVVVQDGGAVTGIDFYLVSTASLAID
jgi:uncharacterized surface anchored protein